MISRPRTPVGTFQRSRLLHLNRGFFKNVSKTVGSVYVCKYLHISFVSQATKFVSEGNMVIFEPVFLQSDKGNTNVSLRSVLFWCKKGRGQHDGNVKPLSGGFKLGLRWFSRFCKKYVTNIMYVVGDLTSTLWYRLDNFYLLLKN